jgi:hypothetical protein
MPIPVARRSSPKLTPLSGSIFCTAIFGFLTLLYAILAFTPLGAWPWYINVIIMLGNAFGTAGFYGSWKRTVAKREEEREERWKEWLSKPIPELEPPIDWAEIERATEHLTS